MPLNFLGVMAMLCGEETDEKKEGESRKAGVRPCQCFGVQGAGVRLCQCFGVQGSAC